MSKSTIILVITWVLIGLVGAFLGGYFWENKVCKNAITNSEKSNVVAPATTTNPTSNSTPNDSNKTITQPNGTTSSTLTSTDTNKTVVPPTKK